MNIVENIFSIKDYGETHHIMRILGLKFKFPKKEYAKKRKENLYYYYKKNNIDITTIPPAEGQIRDIQLANLELLKELDYVCKQNNLQYWLDFGTTLGAVRHKGFIPWDDDIDTGMLREDYYKIIDAFKTTSRNPDIFADYVRSEKNPCQFYIKVQHKKCSHLFVDIFPYDKYFRELDYNGQLKLTDVCKKEREYLNKNTEYSLSNEDILEKINISREKILSQELGECSNEEKCTLVWGVDFNHGWKNWAHSSELIFPLKNVEFEGLNFPTVNMVNEYMTDVYGDYMAYPKKIGVGHSMFIPLSVEEKSIINKLTEKEEV